MKRKNLPSATQVEILTKSGRRCALCFGLLGDFTEKQGQIAHLDKDPSNHGVSNLAFLCLGHHDKYDSKNSQSKGYQKDEVIEYRRLLYKKVEAELRTETIFDDEVSIEENRFERILQTIEKFWRLEKSPDFLAIEISTRCRSLYEFLKLYHSWLQTSVCYEKGPQFEFFHDRELERLHTYCGIPEDIWGLSEGELPNDWLIEVEELASLFASGSATRDDCLSILWEFDERFDLDFTWLLFGVSINSLPRLSYQLFENFVFNFGTRNLVTSDSE